MCLSLGPQHVGLMASRILPSLWSYDVKCREEEMWGWESRYRYLRFTETATCRSDVFLYPPLPSQEEKMAGWIRGWEEGIDKYGRTPSWRAREAVTPSALLQVTSHPWTIKSAGLYVHLNFRLIHAIYMILLLWLLSMLWCPVMDSGSVTEVPVCSAKY